MKKILKFSDVFWQAHVSLIIVVFRNSNLFTSHYVTNVFCSVVNDKIGSIIIFKPEKIASESHK